MKILLVVTYLATSGQPEVFSYEMSSWTECARKGAQLSKNVKAGKVSTVCWRSK